MNEMYEKNWGNSGNDYHPKALPITKENRLIYMCVALALSIISIACVVGVIFLDYVDKDIPQALIAMGSTAIVALGGLFTLHLK